MRPVNGLHHITAISGPAQENLDFYSGVLGMRLVKKSVNQDDTGTYHLFYADAEGHPGTDLTFFPWAQMAPPRIGYGLAVEVGLEVPARSLEYWGKRLETYGARVNAIETRFGERTLSARRSARTPPRARRARESRRAVRLRPGITARLNRTIRCAASTARRLWERGLAPTTTFLTSVLGFKKIAEENGWTRFGFDNATGVLDIRETPEERRGAWGVGSVHHLAWRVDDETHQLAVRGQVETAGRQATPVIDRFWFKSVYFQEPGGVLFELATDGPGFAVDEDREHLGETLVLPPWLEPSRPEHRGRHCRRSRRRREALIS